MNQQPDKLFRDKLQGYQRPAPPGAWNRIAGKLHKKSHGGIWLKVAAAILLLAVAGILLFPMQDEPVQNVIAEKVIAPKKEESPRSNEVVPPENFAQPEREKKKNSPGVTPNPAYQTKRTERKERHDPIKEQEANEEALLIASEEIVPIETPGVPVSEDLVAINEPVTAQPTKGNGSVTLIFDADEVDEKYLNKNAMAEATSEGKQPSTLRKLLDKAYDLKHNQDPIGDLRQKKNEILALNFKSDKQRSQNK